MITVEGVTKRYGDVVAVEDLSFQVSRGEVVGFLGPNGAGKSTTMKMITGTLQPDAGAVRFDGEPIAADLVAAKRRVGYLPEANPLYDELLVADYLEYVAELRGLTIDQTRSGISDAVDETDIASVFYRPIGECSKGFRQRIGLAAAILHRPEVLILDEPTEGLDPNQRVEIRRLVGALGRERTVVLSTHVMQEVESTCSRLIILRRGRLAADGPVDDLVADRTAGVRYVVEAEGEGVVRMLAGLPGVSGHTERSVEGRARVELHSREGRELRPEIFAMARDRGWILWELHREKASLEQLFRDLTGDEAEAAEAVETAGDEAEAAEVVEAAGDEERAAGGIGRSGEGEASR